MTFHDAEADGQHHAMINNAHLFESKQIRHNFIKKVYSLLAVQLIITVAVVALFALHPDVHHWARVNRWFHTASFVVAFVVLIGITCMGELRRKHPHNLIALFTFTIAESLMLAAVTVMFDTHIVLMAGAMTAVVCIALTLFAFQTRIDFTVFNGIMIIVLLVATMTLLVSMFFPQSKLFILIASSIMAVIMGIFLVIDTQMIIGGTHSVQISPEEYIFAAINLYLDIINMFLYILTILSQDGH